MPFAFRTFRPPADPQYHDFHCRKNELRLAQNMTSIVAHAVITTMLPARRLSLSRLMANPSQWRGFLGRWVVSEGVSPSVVLDAL